MDFFPEWQNAKTSNPPISTQCERSDPSTTSPSQLMPPHNKRQQSLSGAPTGYRYSRASLAARQRGQRARTRSAHVLEVQPPIRPCRPMLSAYANRQEPREFCDYITALPGIIAFAQNMERFTALTISNEGDVSASRWWEAVSRMFPPSSATTIF